MNPQKIIVNSHRVLTETYNTNHAIHEVILKSNVKEVERNSFFNCIHLKKVDFSEAVMIDVIQSNTFLGCFSLQKIDIPSHINRIEEFAFYGCSSLKSVQMHGVQSIGMRAFGNCYALEDIEISESIREIDDTAFYSIPKENILYVKVPDSFRGYFLSRFPNTRFKRRLEI